jgi:phosphomannomutase/phosphoglucomutase
MGNAIDVDNRNFVSMVREYDVRGRVSDEEMNEASVAHIAAAYAVYLERRGIKKAVLGYDSRDCSPAFAEAALESLLGHGIDVHYVGLATSPLVYYAQHLYGSEGAVMITASHNPDGWSGFKLAKGLSETLEPDDIRELFAIVRDLPPPQGGGHSVATDAAPQTGDPSPRGTIYKEENTRESYISEIVGRVSLGPHLPRVVIDAGNGGAGLFAWEVFYRLGCPTFQLNCDPDTSFPHYYPNPSDMKARARLREMVTHPYIRADIGIGFDGDGDRIGVIDGSGADIWSDRILAVLAEQLLEAHPGATIVYDVKCTKALGDVITAAGGRPLMWKTGHSYIKSKMHETGAPLAGERSGHIFYGGGDWYGFDDAIFTAAKLIEYLSHRKETIAEILAGYPQYVTSPEIKARCADTGKYAVMEQVVAELKESFPGRVNDINGARVDFGHGWGLARPSSNLPEIVIIFEADTREHMLEIRAVFREVLGRHPEIDPEWENDL